MSEHEFIAATAERIKRTTSVQPHEAQALMRHEGDPMVADLFTTLGEIDLINSRLYKQLVEWHTRFPEKPTLEESDIFWRELKRLREAKLEMGYALERIKAKEKEINTLSNQLQSSQQQIADIERYFDSYLDRVQESR